MLSPLSLSLCGLHFESLFEEQVFYFCCVVLNAESASLSSPRKNILYLQQIFRILFYFSTVVRNLPKRFHATFR